MQTNIELSVILPCLNERETLASCISSIQETVHKEHILTEIIVANNGSTDGSAEIAYSLGAKVVTVNEKGYGSALMGGIRAASGKYIIMGDPDGSYDFKSIPRFLHAMKQGNDIVMGNRFMGGVEKGAMSLSHVIGNHLLSGLASTLFQIPIHDFHCGLRSFSRECILREHVICHNFNFATEMIIRAHLLGITMTEVPITLFRDGRHAHKSYLHTMRDGMKNLLLILAYWLQYIQGGSAQALRTHLNFSLTH